MSGTRTAFAYRLQAVGADGGGMCEKGRGNEGGKRGNEGKEEEVVAKD